MPKPQDVQWITPQVRDFIRSRGFDPELETGKIFIWKDGKRSKSWIKPGDPDAWKDRIALVYHATQVLRRIKERVQQDKSAAALRN